jgi:hypothetical protein
MEYLEKLNKLKKKKEHVPIKMEIKPMIDSDEEYADINEEFNIEMFRY